MRFRAICEEHALSGRFRRSLVRRRLSRISGTVKNHLKNKVGNASSSSMKDLTLISWFYLDDQDHERGPYSTGSMKNWYWEGYLTPNVRLRHEKLDLVKGIETSNSKTKVYAYYPLQLYFPNLAQAFESYAFVDPAAEEANKEQETIKKHEDKSTQQQWILTNDSGKEEEPMSTKELLNGIKDGRIHDGMLVRKRGESRWERKSIGSTIIRMSSIDEGVVTESIDISIGTDKVDPSIAHIPPPRISGLGLKVKRVKSVDTSTRTLPKSVGTRPRRISTKPVSLSKQASWLTQKRQSGPDTGQETRSKSNTFSDLIWIAENVEANKEF